MITYYPELVADLRKIRHDPAKFARALIGRRDRNGEDHGVDEHAAQRSEAIRTRLSTATNPLFFDHGKPTQHALDLLARHGRSYDAYEASGWDRSAIFDGSDCLHCVSRKLAVPGGRGAFLDCSTCPGFYISAEGQIVEKRVAPADDETAFEILVTCTNIEDFYNKGQAAGMTVSECSRLLGVLSDRYTVTPYRYPEAEIEIKR